MLLLYYVSLLYVISGDSTYYTCTWYEFYGLWPFHVRDVRDQWPQIVLIRRNVGDNWPQVALLWKGFEPC